MIGTNATDGRPLDGIEHLRQSISDILTTPLGSRVMRRTYGSLAFELIDRAANATGQMLLKAVCADALAKWEPRLLLQRIALSNVNMSGGVEIDIEGEYIETGVLFSVANLSLSLGVSKPLTSGAVWWSHSFLAAARVADYKHGRYMSLGQSVLAEVVSHEARNTTALVSSLSGTVHEVGVNALAIGEGIGLEISTGATNLLTENPIANETLIVVIGTEYTLSLAGSGDATLSGAGTGVASDAVPVTFVATVTSLTVVLSGSADYLWLEEGTFAGPPLAPGATRDGSNVTVSQGSTPSTNLHDGQPWNVISGVTQTATHLIFDGTQADGSLAVRITGFPTSTGDVVNLTYEVTDHVAGEVGLTVSLNPAPSRIVAVGNGIFTQTMTVGASQGDRLIFVSDNGFQGKILLSSNSVTKEVAVTFPGRTGTEQTARYDWDTHGRTGENFVIASEVNPGGDELRLHMVDGKVMYESLLTGVSQGFVQVDGKDDGLPHSAIVHGESGAGTLSLSVDGGAVHGPNIFSAFATLAPEWTNNDDGSWSCDGTQAGGADARDDGRTTIGVLFEWTYTISDASSDMLIFRGHSSPVSRGNGTYTETVLSNSIYFIFRALAGNAATISNISVRPASTRSDITLPDGLNFIREGRDAVGNHINGFVTLSAQANGDHFDEWVAGQEVSS